MLNNIVMFINSLYLALLLTSCSSTQYNLSFKEFLVESNKLKEQDLKKYNVEGLDEKEKLFWFNYINKK